MSKGGRKEETGEKETVEREIGKDGVRKRRKERESRRKEGRKEGRREEGREENKLKNMREADSL